MKIAIVGLGLIGGSLCKTIKKNTPHLCYGYDLDEASVGLALAQGAIDDVTAPEELCRMDVVFVCLHPRQTIDFLLQNAALLPKNGMVLDVCGVKEEVVQAVTEPLARQGVCFIGTHPMAGREFSGFAYATDNLFDNASFIITPLPDTDPQRLRQLEALALEMRFKRVVSTSPRKHDEIIAFTSHLAHIVSNAYIKSPELQEEKCFSAGSFLDLTRVAKLNEDMWTDLFLMNREPILRELDVLLEHLGQYRQALLERDSETLRALLREGRLLKEASIEQHQYR